MKRSKFSLSHYKLLTCDMGELIPITWFEALPGDTVQQASSLLVRVSPLLAPVMHPVEIKIHHWFVPNRLLWTGWENFITGGPDGMDASVHPHKHYSDVMLAGGLADYLGLAPQSVVGDSNVSALPFRAYNLIFNEWYRDADLVAELPIDTAGGYDTGTTVNLQKVAWEKDYFTTARPWSQKGPDVSVPFGAYAPVVPDPGAATPNTPVFRFNTNLSQLSIDGSTNNIHHSTASFPASALSWEDTALRTDLSSATAVNINELRTAFALQRYAEARARYGSRYTEYLAYLGVRSSDARLQRPEYLGGGKQTIQFSEVLQTGPSAGDPADSFVGDLKGHGIGAVRSNRYRRFFEEHGIVMSLMHVKPKTIYAQGIHRSWSRPTKEDYFQRELQHVGQQEVFNREVYGAHSAPTGVFGYQDRYDEYRRIESSIAGDFRSTLDHWHYARIFGSDVTLNGAFVTADPTKRVNAVQTEDVLWVMANHSIQARRMVSGSARSFIL